MNTGRKGLKEKIAVAIAGSGSEGVTAFEVEKLVDLERHTLSKYLSVMEREGVLNYRLIGKSRLWYINKAPMQKLVRSKEQSLSFNEKMLLNIASKLPVGMVVIDSDYNIHFSNEAVTREYGPVDNQKFYSSILGRENASSLKKINELVDGSAANCEFKSFDIKENILRIKGSKFVNPDQGLSIVLMIEDVTEKELAEHRLEEAYGKLKEVDHLKSAVLRDAAVQLKYPVSLIAMTSSLLNEELKKKEPSREKERKYLDILLRNSGLFDEQLSAILQLGRLQSKESLLKEPIDLSDTVRLVAKEFEKACQAKGIQLKKNLEKIPRFDANERLITALVRNLLGNAMKFTEKGSIEIACRKEGANAVVSVKDTGIGISRENIGKIFVPFSKLSATTEGLGVGLSLCREIAQLHGGAVSAESVPGKGSTFTVVLPLTGGN